MDENKNLNEEINEIEELFGNQKLSYEELSLKSSAAGIEIGNLTKARDEFSAILHKTRVEAALKEALTKAGARNNDIVINNLDFTKITSDEDGVYGIDEQISKLVADAPYLFEGEKDEKITFSTGVPHTKRTFDASALSDAEFYKSVKLM